jgi:hypothetical protein
VRIISNTRSGGLHFIIINLHFLAIKIKIYQGKEALEFHYAFIAPLFYECSWMLQIHFMKALTILIDLQL